jgi:hypothetical protein
MPSTSFSPSSSLLHFEDRLQSREHRGDRSAIARSREVEYTLAPPVTARAVRPVHEADSPELVRRQAVSMRAEASQANAVLLGMAVLDLGARGMLVS